MGYRKEVYDIGNSPNSDAHFACFRSRSIKRFQVNSGSFSVVSSHSSFRVCSIYTTPDTSMVPALARTLPNPISLLPPLQQVNPSERSPSNLLLRRSVNLCHPLHSLHLQLGRILRLRWPRNTRQVTLDMIPMQKVPL